MRGEAPIASHLLYTQPGILDDADHAERLWGIEAGLAWRDVADASVVYIDRGISTGMKHGVRRAQGARNPGRVPEPGGVPAPEKPTAGALKRKEGTGVPSLPRQRT